MVEKRRGAADRRAGPSSSPVSPEPSSSLPLPDFEMFRTILVIDNTVTDIKRIGKRGGKKKERNESGDDGEADEDIGSDKNGASPPPAKRAKRDKEEHNEESSLWAM
ncbi:hypothetical protein IW262DRAFT_1299177 [Armillaria fumosa]|nr:hypothetical protein IW262DRAFT_1299177 [Armillaria fumosa]